MKKFEMPAVLAGDIVFWKDHPSSENQHVAMVVVHHGQMLTLAVFIDGSATVMPRHEVFHKDDPEALRDVRDGGCWFPRPAPEKPKRTGKNSTVEVDDAARTAE